VGGLAGFWGGRCSADERAAQLMRMTHAISHRGPDAQGYWADHAAAIAIGHRRLAVVDPSEAGAQPMLSAGGRYVLSFDGQIYNHLELRRELESAEAGIRWRGHSDTETLLAGLGAWGIAETVQRAVGMFAIAVWDRKLRLLTLARDRLGEKPLYYAAMGTGASAAFLFASELGGLTACRGFQGEVDRDALCLFMRHGSIGGARTIFRDVHKLLPGHSLTLGDAAFAPVVEPYWSLAQVAERGAMQRFKGDAAQAVEQLEALVTQAVGQQMASDVPLGALLSDGVDASAIVALMQSRSIRRIKTFAVSFDAADDEAGHIRTVARHIGTDHTELCVTPKDVVDTVGLLPRLYGEPLADPSQIASALVSRLARREVTVALSGGGGDEIFGGYSRYQMTARLWGRLAAVPVPMRRAAARVLQRLPPHRLDRIAACVPGLGRWSQLGSKLHQGARIMASASSADLYLGLVSHWSDPADVVLGGCEPASLLTGLRPILNGLNDVERMMALHGLTCLPDSVLAKIDRAAMGIGLETRLPFLDHRLVEFAWQLPLDMKLRREPHGTTTQWILRRMLSRHVPRAVFEHPERGSGIPVGRWLRGPLREWAESLLSRSRLDGDGFFDTTAVRRRWTEHLSGHQDWQHPLWCVLMFQTWLDEQASWT
jgi:asparagine synthase (glutamine-hydrolysing)